MTLDAADVISIADAVAAQVSEALGTQETQLLDHPALARRLDVGERTVSSLVQRNYLPPGYLIGGARRWDWQEVRKFLHATGNRKPRRGRGRYDRSRARKTPGKEPS